VAVRGADGTLVVLDAGTGIHRLGAAVGPEVGRVDLLLTHLHMDHIQGLGFFAPLYRPGLAVHIWAPPSTSLDLHGRLSRYLSPPLFPVRLRDLPCQLTLHDVPSTPFALGGLQIQGALIVHPGPTVGYRIIEGEAALAYLPDHEPAIGAERFPLAAEWTSGYELAAGVDLLIHDAQYSAAEYPAHVGWGHSALPHMLAFATLTRVKRLVTFHHDPGHSDAALDQLHAEARATFTLAFELIAGTEGASFEVGAPVQPVA
jgi:phosphoribosyl 1,2-cyclic phosphodiesterase